MHLPNFASCAFLLVGLALVATPESHFHATLQEARAQGATKGAGNKGEPEVMDFIVNESGKGLSRDGSPFSFTEYMAPDGVSVVAKQYKKASPKLALKELKFQLDAATVIERGANRDHKQTTVGQRFVVTYKVPGESSRSFRILFTYEEIFHTIESKSMRHALALERFLRE